MSISRATFLLAIVAASLVTTAVKADDLAATVANKLRDSGAMKGYRVNVKAKSGTVWLEGTVSEPRQIEAAVAAYPYPHSYRAWPGPNSNTFTAFVARRVPELGLDLPPTAIGKDWLGGGTLVATTPSGTGWQLSLAGVLGVATIAIWALMLFRGVRGAVRPAAA